MADTQNRDDFIELNDLLHRRGWNMRTVKTFLNDSDRETDPAGPEQENPIRFSLAKVEGVEKTGKWKTQAENLERKRESQRQREMRRWERERPTYLQVGEMELGSSCRITIPAFPGLKGLSPEAPAHDLAVLEPLAGDPWKTVIYRVQGRKDERLTFSLFAFSGGLVPADFEGEVTDDSIRRIYPFLIPTWEPSIFEEDAEAAFRAVENERIPWETVSGPRRLPFRLLAVGSTESPEETTSFVMEMDDLFHTTRRKRKNTAYSTFVRNGYRLFPHGCAVPAGGAEGLQGIFVHRNGHGLIDGIWIDLDFSENMP